MCRPTKPKESSVGASITDDANVSDDSRSTETRVLNLVIDLCLAIYTIGFSFFRIGELIPLFAAYPRHCLSAVIGTVILRRPLGRPMRRLLHVLTLAVTFFLVDFYIPAELPSANDARHVETCAITGANSGVGFETARRLAVEYGIQVILGCRSVTKCAAAAETINAEAGEELAVPVIIDLASFESVSAFAAELNRREIQVDVLFNNAGFVPTAGSPTNSYDLESSFTAMHISHHLLADFLVKSNPTLRVINTSSATHHLCALPFAYVPKVLLEWLHIPYNPGCVDDAFLDSALRRETGESAYIEAKVANVMHALEMPRRYSGSTAVAIDLGWVGTAIQPFMQGTFLTPTKLGWMRRADIGIIPVLHAIFSSDSALVEALRTDGTGWKNGGVVMDVYGRVEEAFSYPWWTKNGASSDVGRERMEMLSRKLWDCTSAILGGSMGNT